MDRMLYLASNGAAHLERAQAVHANNLANVSTDGFRREFAQTMDRAIRGDGHAARTFALSEGTGFDFGSGVMRETGRNLDVAIKGNGLLAVQMPDGSEGYTRAGALQVDSAGRLLSPEGLPVLGSGGPVAVPPLVNLFVGEDGGITIRPEGQGPESLVQVDQLKLVSAPPEALAKAAPGIFQARDGQNLEVDETIKVAGGSLESSNVNAVSELTDILAIARQFELEVRMMQKVEENDEASSQLVRIS